ncbi:MAG: TolC family protein [Flavobacteriales bacterium]|nr:TolC family protein [Flavobacteriales bacterium]
MKKINKFSFIVFFIMCSLQSQVYTLEDFIADVKQNHPIAKQSNLKIQEGENLLVYAKGQMDPTLYSDFKQKEYSEKLYYKLWETELSIPVFGGIDAYTNYSLNDGIYLNPQNNLPESGLIQFGVKVDVFGIWNNKRNLGIKKAKLQRTASEYEQKILMNYLVADALENYLDWSKNHKILTTQKQFISVAKERYENTKKLHQLGEIPAIDTLEAYIQYQSRTANFNDAFADYVSSSLRISSFTWNEKGENKLLDENEFPQNLDEIITYESNSIDINQHPEIQTYRNKIEQLKLEEKLNKRELFPKLYAKYNFLNKGNNFAENIQIQPNNYTFGINFKFPLFNRQQRANLNLTQLEIQNKMFETNTKINDLEYKIKVVDNEKLNIQNQIELYNEMNSNYSQLLQAEKIKFSIGESSLFVVNSRETKYIDSLLKNIELKKKHQSLILKKYLLLGTIYDFNP